MTADLSAISNGAISNGAANSGALASKSPASAAGKEAGGACLEKIRPAPDPGETLRVRFAFNPERITISHAYKTAGVTGTKLDEQIKNLGFVEISVDKVLLIGTTTKDDCETLIKWSCPAPTSKGVSGQQQDAQPVVLRFTWGTGLSFEVSLRMVTITYVRFAPVTGQPIRAEVRLAMYKAATTPLPPGSNPTSGGPPGRSAHMLDSSECLASLAAASYGRPGAWRSIARANGIDDPLRTPAGTLLYLPETGPADGAGRNL